MLYLSPNEQEADLLALYTYGQLLELVTTLTNRASRKMAGLNPGTPDYFAKLLIFRFFFLQRQNNYFHKLLHAQENIIWKPLIDPNGSISFSYIFHAKLWFWVEMFPLTSPWFW